MLEINVYKDLLKDLRLLARFDWTGRLFQSLAPLYENLLWPFGELFFGILRSVAVFLQLHNELLEVAANKLIRYCEVQFLI